MSTSFASWFQERVNRLYEIPPASGEDNFPSDFEATFASAAKITVNGVEIPRDTLKEQFTLQRAASVRNELEWKDVIEVPKEADAEASNVSQGGIVAGYLIVTKSSKLRIRVGPAQHQTFSVFHAFIGDDPDVTSNTRRRILKLDEVMLNKPVPINLGFPQSS